jgi:hypothetical protein
LPPAIFGEPPRARNGQTDPIAILRLRRGVPGRSSGCMTSEFWQAVASGAGVIAFLVAQFASLLLIPFGLPGTWVQVLAAAIFVAATGGAKMGWLWVALFAVLALIGEAVEFVSGKWGARKFGGSDLAGWGALAGGFAGLFLGGLIPIPVVGSLIMSFAGTFAGAVLGEMHQQRRLRAPDAPPQNGNHLRVGFGAVLGRVLGIAAKLSIGCAIAIVSVVVVVCNILKAAP